MAERTFQRLQHIIRENGAGFVLLIDPDKLSRSAIAESIPRAVEQGVDVLFIGGTFLFQQEFNPFVEAVKKAAGDTPVVLFPGSIFQLSPHADALLYLSLISSRNAEFLIGNQVQAAPLVWKMGLETIACAYMMVESGKLTSAAFLSNSHPIPRDKPDVAVAHALAAQYLGMKLVYLEAGSGAQQTVPVGMISAVSRVVELPLIVGGGIRSPEEAAKKVAAGASFVVVGNYFEDQTNWQLLGEFADAIHRSRRPQ